MYDIVPRIICYWKSCAPSERMKRAYDCQSHLSICCKLSPESSSVTILMICPLPRSPVAHQARCLSIYANAVCGPASVRSEYGKKLCGVGILLITREWLLLATCRSSSNLPPPLPPMFVIMYIGSKWSIKCRISRESSQLVSTNLIMAIMISSA